MGNLNDRVQSTDIAQVFASLDKIIMLTKLLIKFLYVT